MHWLQHRSETWPRQLMPQESALVCPVASNRTHFRTYKHSNCLIMSACSGPGMARNILTPRTLISSDAHLLFVWGNHCKNHIIWCNNAVLWDYNKAVRIKKLQIKLDVAFPGREKQIKRHPEAICSSNWLGCTVRAWSSSLEKKHEAREWPPLFWGPLSTCRICWSRNMILPPCTNRFFRGFFMIPVLCWRSLWEVRSLVTEGRDGIRI